MSAAICQFTILLASAMAGVAAVSVGMLYGSASAFVGLLYGLKAFICMLVAGNRYFEGVMVVGLAIRRHRGAGHGLPVLQPARCRGVLRPDRRALLPAERSVRLLCDLRQANEPREHGACRHLHVADVAMALGLYITAMSGQLSMATAAIAGVGGYLAAVLTVKFRLGAAAGDLSRCDRRRPGRHDARASHAQECAISS